MRDGLAIRQFPGRSLLIDVNPLKIVGRIGKPVDALLIDCDPVRDADLPPFQGLGILD